MKTSEFTRVVVTILEEEQSTKSSQSLVYNDVLILYVTIFPPWPSLLSYSPVMSLHSIRRLASLRSRSTISKNCMCPDLSWWAYIFRGAVEVPFRDICANIKQVMMINMDEGTIPSKVKTASIKVKFDLAGPGANICPKCTLFIGNADALQHGGHRFHVSCLTCQNCAKALHGNPFAVRKIKEKYQFFDIACNIKKFGDDTNFEICDSTQVQGR